MRTTLRVPFGYGTETITLGGLQTWLLRHHHPEYVRRLLGWLDHKGGPVGVGSGWRADGTQPDKPGFAPEGRSFHQNQRYSDGFIGAAAVDLVIKNPGGGVHSTIPWNQVPRQGSAEAKFWGVHCNIDSEAWHMQPIEIDGWQSWINAGSPAPVANYNVAPPPNPTPIPPQTGTLLLYKVVSGDSYWKICEKLYEDNKATNERVAALQQANGNKALQPGDIINVPGKLAA